ncbi:lactate dehydrogenase [Salinivibrio socompensis]|uniref:lactate dehydrogenase n=1 Tax=Salinivibrio socompensis TaxID=1510206 RepID=UPI00046E8AF3|nr:lactate dehydrogenase [Salinivibrio socompensis]
MSSGKLPPASGLLQLNFCKTLTCPNFGSMDEQDYLVQRSNPARPTLVCRECGAFPPLLNNHQVHAELIAQRQRHADGLCACTNPACEHLGKPVLTHRHCYHAFGYSGDRQRYRCKGCQSTFVDRWSGANKKSELQQKLLAFLFTGHTVREICRRLSLNPKTFYDHLNQIAARCRQKLAAYDTRFLADTSTGHLASVHAPLQPQSQNGVQWLATGEAHSGYILLQDVNYHPYDHDCLSDHHDPYQDACRFMATANAGQRPETTPRPDGLLGRVDAKYREVFSRSNVEDPYTQSFHFIYPNRGTLIRPQYTTYAHYLNLKPLIDHWQHIVVFSPQEPLLRSACLSVFEADIRDKRVSHVYVEQDAYWQPGSEPEKIDIVLLSWWRDRWAFTRSGEGNKAICDHGQNKGREAYWLTHASCDAMKKYQQHFHQQFSLLVNEPRRRLRPGGLLPLLDIYRAWHNLCWQDHAHVTPAQRLGLTERPLTLADLML